jgi:hypothetical protein
MSAVAQEVALNGPLHIGAHWSKLYRIDEDAIVAYALGLKTKNQAHLNHDAARAMGYERLFAPGVMLYGLVEETVTEYAPRLLLRETNLKYKLPLYAPESVIVTVACEVRGTRKGMVKIWVDVYHSDRLAYGTCSIIPRA